MKLMAFMLAAAYTTSWARAFESHIQYVIPIPSHACPDKFNATSGMEGPSYLARVIELLPIAVGHKDV